MLPQAAAGEGGLSFGLFILIFAMEWAVEKYITGEKTNEINYTYKENRKHRNNNCIHNMG